ncbi:MAG: Dynein light chain [Cyphobasidiales sp. Tagirdzhanova-0007]|nr:MAG: Dynein light chain [Cyphobasidiales sp. Tagirdzhanova-0007]
MVVEKQESSCESPKAVVKAVDMSETLQEAAISIAQKAFGDHSVEKDIAQYIKKEFDRLLFLFITYCQVSPSSYVSYYDPMFRQYGATWHCIVGKNFGSFVTHESGNFIYYYVGSIAILLFKSG